MQIANHNKPLWRRTIGKTCSDFAAELILWQTGCLNRAGKIGDILCTVGVLNQSIFILLLSVSKSLYRSRTVEQYTIDCEYLPYLKPINE
jgi:hypothetical protein